MSLLLLLRVDPLHLDTEGRPESEFHTRGRPASELQTGVD